MNIDIFDLKSKLFIHRTIECFEYIRLSAINLRS